MQMTGNTILITGGGTGIGRGLAEAFHARGNQVILAGRRKEVLEEVVAANVGMQAITLDMESPDAIREFAAKLVQNNPKLNAVVHNAGIMRPEDVQKGEVADAEATIATNLLGPIRLTGALLPHFLTQPRSTILTVTSGLAFIPLAMTPTYCATKAAIHSYTESLRFQLRNTPVEVIELVPPYVQTELMGARQANDPNAMPLKEFINETMALLESSPDAGEILVERVKPLRFAPRRDNYQEFFEQRNAAH